MATKKTGKVGQSREQRETNPKPLKRSKQGRGGRSTAAQARHTQSAHRAGRTSDEQTRQLALSIGGVGLAKLALNVEVIDVRGKVDYADYMVLMSGRSQRQVAAIADHIQVHVSSNGGPQCLGLEGLPHGSWVLMDFGDVVVHIFHQDTRGYYDLESLWLDAARVAVE